MIANAAELPRRYPGLKPFERSQSAVFHGRRDDIQRLSNLVLRERLVVLFAKSGIGKTSLLQAGVAPEIERQDYAMVFLRADKTDAPILDGVSSMLNSSPHVSGRDSTGETPGQFQTLWEQVKRLEFDLSGLPATPVLVFDQFEEVFTLAHSEDSRNRFLNALAELANETMPESLRSSLLRRFQEGEIDVATMQWWEKQPELRIVLSIRSDFLHLLDGISARIPGILRNRYQLQPLDREKARMAIVQPAQAEGAFVSPPFQYSEAALLEMIDFLAGNEAVETEKEAENAQSAKKRDEIETVNLQIVCQDVEEKIIDLQKPEDFEVAPDFYGQREGLAGSIRHFYDNQLDAFPKAYADRVALKAKQGGKFPEADMQLLAQKPEVLRGTAQRLIEESLITSGNRRNSVVDDTLLDAYDVTPDFLDTLVDKSRLLRKEPRLDDFYYEISHDTLLPAIIHARNKRREQERAFLEKQAYEARLAEEAQRRTDMEQQLATAQKQRALARRVAITSVVAAVISVIALGFSIYLLKDYMRSARDQLAQAELNTRNEIFDAALRGYAELSSNGRRKWILRNTTPFKDVDAEMRQAALLKIKFDSLAWHLHQSDSLLVVQDYAAALHAYRQAQAAANRYETANRQCSLAPNGQMAWRVDSALIARKHGEIAHRIGGIGEIMIGGFEVSQRDFETFKEAKVWGQAYRNLLRMQQLLPRDSADQALMQQKLKLGEPPANFVARELQWHRRLLGL
jgi:hypothetical protein